MELNKKKSLLTPAAPTVWGMIHGDIDKQTDIVERIAEKVDEAVGPELSEKIRNEVFAELNPILENVVEQTQPRLEAGVNIKTFSGRSILGEGDMDPLNEGDRMLLETIETKADRATVYSKKEVDDLLDNVKIDDSNLATKEELQETAIKATHAFNLAESAHSNAISTKTQVTELRTYVDEQLGAIDTMTDDILG